MVKGIHRELSIRRSSESHDMLQSALTPRIFAGKASTHLDIEFVHFLKEILNAIVASPRMK